MADALLPEKLSASGAVFNSTRTHRYVLWRLLEEHDPKRAIAFIGLNPSTADEVKNDPTVTRCIGYARRWGYGRFFMLNIFSLRSTDPKGLYNCPCPAEPRNDRAIMEVARRVERVMLCWGNHGRQMERGQKVLDMLQGFSCYHLTKTKAGQPGHPLYLKASLDALRWEFEG